MIWGVVAITIALVLVVLGSAGLRWFDAALVGYLFGTLFAIFEVTYRYAVWLRRPPTALLHQRGWQALRQRDLRAGNARMIPGLIGPNLLAQTFIRRRSSARWIAHQLVFWGCCVLAALVTFPLVFGWLNFESVVQNAREYQAFVVNWGTVTFDSRSVVGWLTFHLLDIAAVLVVAGVFILLARRLRDPGALAVERSNDFLALAGMFAVSVTGLMSSVVYCQADEQRMVCLCHEGVFDARTGNVRAGPPQRPLGRIDVEVRDGVVWAQGAQP